MFGSFKKKIDINKCAMERSDTESKQKLSKFTDDFSSKIISRSFLHNLIHFINDYQRPSAFRNICKLKFIEYSLQFKVSDVLLDKFVLLYILYALLHFLVHLQTWSIFVQTTRFSYTLLSLAGQTRKTFTITHPFLFFIHTRLFLANSNN